MSGVRIVTINADDAGLRLDRWFARHFPAISHGRLEKLLRTGQIRVDGRRARAGFRLAAGQSLRIPPQPAPEAASARKRKVDHDDPLACMLADRVLYMDEEILAIDKPPGLPVQGGTGTVRHVDGALPGLRFGLSDAPRLVHRLDRDTSGVLLLARTASAARRLTRVFRMQEAEKVYWALVAGELRPAVGTINLPVAKVAGRAGETMQVSHAHGRPSVTDYQVAEQLGHRVAWVVLRPRTGRTHQLRVHMAASGVPVLGDGKYGGGAAFVDAEGVSRKLHLHARSLALSGRDGRRIEISAPLPPHMTRSWQFFGFDPGRMPAAGVRDR